MYSQLSEREEFLGKEIVDAAYKVLTKRHGFTDENIPYALEVTNNKAIEDKAFYEYIKNAVNNSVKVDTEKVEGVWTDSFQKSYQFIIK
jgi:hypothetical protein